MQGHNCTESISSLNSSSDTPEVLSETRFEPGNLMHKQKLMGSAKLIKPIPIQTQTLRKNIQLLEMLPNTKYLER